MFDRRRLEEDWPFEVSNAEIRYRVARPDSSGIDTFDCGNEWWAAEVNEYVRERSWVDHAVIVALEFGCRGETVGFAFVVLTKKRHPDSSTPDKALYEAVVYAGINMKFQGQPDLGTPEKDRQNLSVTMFRGIEEHARRLPEQPVGLWLQVREANQHAIRFYERIGFVTDSRGVFKSTDKAQAPTIEMRKLF
jgi:hypothetical protein